MLKSILNVTKDDDEKHLNQPFLEGETIVEREIKKNRCKMKLTYTIQFVDFQDEEVVDCTNTDQYAINYQTSSKEKLICYTLKDSYFKTETKMFFEQKVFEYKGNLLNQDEYMHWITLFETQNEKIHCLSPKDEHFVIDSQNRVWQKTTSYEEKDNVVAEYGDLLVVDQSLYTLTSLFERLDGGHYILIRNQLYRLISEAKILFENQNPVPFMRTNLLSQTPLKGTGLYSTIVLDGTKTVIVPISEDYVYDNDEEFQLVVMNKVIYSIVGDAKEVGFSEIDYRSQLVVTKRPSQEFCYFFESIQEINRNEYKTPTHDEIMIEILDEEFKNRKPKFLVGDKVQIIKELTEHSNLKGLEGIIVSLTNNKAKATIQFFGHFKEDFPIDYFQLVNDSTVSGASK